MGRSVGSERTIFIVERDPKERTSVAALAASMAIKSQEHESAEEFLAAYDRARGGCLVSAMELPGISGIELMEVMARRGLHLPTIIVNACSDIRPVVRAMNAGAVTVLERPYRAPQLAEAISEALAIDSQLREAEARLVRAQCRLASLTSGEKRVLELIQAGSTNRAIARELAVGLRTVEARRHSLMAKLRVRSLPELLQTVAEVQTALVTNRIAPSFDARQAAGADDSAGRNADDE
jgi:two-component system, LuxR family, response regulator FixJ